MNHFYGYIKVFEGFLQISRKRVGILKFGQHFCMGSSASPFDWATLYVRDCSGTYRTGGQKCRNLASRKPDRHPLLMVEDIYQGLLNQLGQQTATNRSLWSRYVDWACLGVKKYSEPYRTAELTWLSHPLTPPFGLQHTQKLVQKSKTLGKYFGKSRNASDLVI